MDKSPSVLPAGSKPIKADVLAAFAKVTLQRRISPASKNVLGALIFIYTISAALKFLVTVAVLPICVSEDPSYL